VTLRFSCTLRPRYEETDLMGVVYYANYLRYFEVARVEYLRHVAPEYLHTEEYGVGAAVIEAHCRYHAPARFDELLRIRCSVTEVRKVRFRFDYLIERAADGETVASGYTRHAWVDLSTFRPTGAPPGLVDIVLAYERRAA